jgi:hypothetical protein
MTSEDSSPFLPATGQCSIQARHLPETLNYAARRNDRQDRATLSSAANETCHRVSVSIARCISW